MADLTMQRIGPLTAGDGTGTPLRSTRDGATATQDAHGRYQEAVFRGNLWVLSVSSLTIAATHVVGTNPGTPIVAIYNPPGSQVNAVVLRSFVACASGTMGQGGIVWGAVPSGSAISAVGGNTAVNLLSLQNGGSSCRTFSAAALTGNATNTSQIRFIGVPTAGAAAANAQLQTLQEDGGDIVCPPGAILGMFAYAAGTSPVIYAHMIWEEVPIVSGSF